MGVHTRRIRRDSSSRPLVSVGVCLVLSGLSGILGCSSVSDDPPEIASDEGKQRADYEGKDVKVAAKEYFHPRKIYDYFHDMDSIANDGQVTSPDQLLAAGAPRKPGDVKAVELNESEILGRNTWMIWCAGNEGFWDWLANDNLGFIDFLKLVDSRKRSERFRDAGLINEPGMIQAPTASPDEFGLWLDLPADDGTRHWREHYVEYTFSKLASRMHKSQRGLKHPDGESLYLGSRAELPDDGPYDAPSEYVEGERAYGDEYSEYDNIPPPDIYGLSSGVLGLRLFPNPYFDKRARERWDADRYYNDPSYYQDPKLVRPYRVGMSCAFCHASFHPLLPPKDIVNPEWRNISGSIGAQYLRIRASVGNLLKPSDFVYHLLDSQPPGTIDTSLIASDNINNPNAMNAIFRLKERTVLSFRNPPERISMESKVLPSIWADPRAASDPDNPATVPQDVKKLFAALGLGALLKNSNDDNPRYTPRILFDGADSIGANGALQRVYLNIGSYWQRWNQIHQPLIGFTPQTPFAIRHCQANSVSWNETEVRVGGLRDYFLRITPPMPVLDTPGAERRLKPPTKPEGDAATSAAVAQFELERGRTIDTSKLALGRKTFARNCIVCHSSLQPEHREPAPTVALRGLSAEQLEEFKHQLDDVIERREDKHKEWAEIGELWEHQPGQWLSDPAYVAWAEAVVEEPDFWNQNYLSIDYRIPVNLVQTNSGRALATNAVSGHIWQDFSSLSYQQMPSIGEIPFFNIYKGPNGQQDSFSPRHKVPAGVPAGGGGTGFYRVPTLISIWNSAPLFHNNSLGDFNNDPSINGRLDAFDDAIRKLLWPQRRTRTSQYTYNGATPQRLAKDGGLIWRTTEDSYLTIQGKYVPHALSMFPPLAAVRRWFPWLEDTRPRWLTSAIFFLGGFFLLFLFQRRHRRALGLLLATLTILLFAAWLFSKAQPDKDLAMKLATIQPTWLPIVALSLVALALLLPLSWKWTRYAGYSAVLLALVVGGSVYFIAGELGNLQIGPIPAGTPVNLIANINSEAGDKALFRAVGTAVEGLSEIQSRHLAEKDAQAVMREKIAPALLDVSKCPDFVMDRGHDFAWFKSMSDDEKDALIELLKTF